MLVNKRCSPYLDANSDDHNGGRRYITAKFNANSSDLGQWNTWNIVDIETGKTMATFNKNSNAYVGIDTLHPGQGKIYQLVPVMTGGGILLADESISGGSITCLDTVWNNGHNITISGNSTINFTDSACIIMNGGTFQCGNASDGPTTNKNTFQSTGSGHNWKGLYCAGSSVKIYNALFQNEVSGVPLYSVTCTDCPLIDIRYNTFIASDTNSGGINVSYISYSTLTSPPAVYIDYNTFTMNNSRYNAVQVQSFAGLTAGVYIEHNTMTSNGNAAGVLLSTITGGVISNNSITGFLTGINTLLTTSNIEGNAISNTSSVSKGIIATGYSSLMMAPSGGIWNGGMNTITNTSGHSHNIDVNNSIFTMSGGNNTFNIAASDTLAEHLYGSFWTASYPTRQMYNCFELGGTAITSPTLPNNYVTDSSGADRINFTFLAYTCNATPPSGTDIVDIGNGLNDTIPETGGGGGFSSVTDAKNTYDSINVQMRLKHYSTVKNLCCELINNYPDSSQSIASLQTLYMVSNVTDTSTSGRTALKTYYENLILNHGSNTAMVNLSNYLVQKCKVLLRQYSSAMAGFQQIINDNPYSYPGLLASWDYMATGLLMNGGNGGGEGNSDFGLPIADLKPDELYEPNEIDPRFHGDRLYEPDNDKSPFTKQQRIAIQQNINDAVTTSKINEERKIEILKTQSDLGNVKAQKELQVKMALKDVNKPQRPKNIIEHMKIVNSDIQKVFGSKDYKTGSNKPQIPTVFKLHQNYPNPFNPSATIKYDLPKDTKVTIKIYDILGREIRTLVNEFKQAGYYQAIFDGTNFASGVYFYRIEAGNPGSKSGTSFVDSKKMVLVK